MHIKMGKTIPFVKLEVNIFKCGTQAQIGINKEVMNNLSEEHQEKIISELEKAHQNITKVLEKQG